MNNVIDLNKARLKKQHQESLAKGRTPLYVSYKIGKVTATPNPEEDFGERLQKVKTSLERINELMVELRRLKDK